MSSGASWGRKVIDEERTKRNNQCQDCGTEGTEYKPLEFHHIKPTGLNGMGRGMSDRAKDIKEHPESYKLLCIGCHHRAHYHEANSS